MRSSNSAVSSSLLSASVRLSFGLLRENAQHVDGLPRSEDVDLRLLAGSSRAAQLHQRLHVERLDDALEGDLRRALHAWIGGANRGVEPVDGRIEGALGLFSLFGRGCRWK